MTLRIHDSSHAERDPSLLVDNHKLPPVIALSICGSFLPAAAAAVANDVGELIELSTFIVGVAFRMAVHITRRALRIENGSGTWAFSALGEIATQLPSIIEQFHEKEVSRYSAAIHDNPAKVKT